ncbi:MAG: glutamate racemase [Balneola sp.]|nr:glutamate racemase [Balneola sp.]MBO6651065.1 glutamate racemase [Balneola sp.]MBO6712807.1 glutamate racemase [Balneola sp.]MBO6801106.1 glutamate racemase [Balneola sp.]MBO6871298.1 glutamate racemase [Balneola sp.]
MSIDKNAPIGIFDSGIGGLTVAKAVAKALPNEDIIYFGDTARVPYGIKSEETIREYALEITDFLLSKGVKMILIACNTVSASAKNEIKSKTGALPVLDVITSGTEMALNQIPNNHIGVIGTLATVNSKAYEKSIHALNSEIKVTQQACPLLVPLAEEGWIDNEIATKTLENYLSVFEHSNINSLILGCTHYPLFKKAIPSVLKSESIRIIDSADSIALTAKQTLNELDLLNDKGGEFQCFVSDRPQRFQELAERFLGRKISDVVVTHL